MIKQFFRSARSMAQAIFLGNAVSRAASRIVADASDSWLFEEDRHVSTLQELPQYPERRAVCDGETHRLEMLDDCLKSLSEKIARLRAIADMSHARSDDFVEARFLYGAAPLALNAMRRVADPVVTDILFDAPAGRVELDDVLFDLEIAYADTGILPAWQVGHLSRSGSAQNYSGG